MPTSCVRYAKGLDMAFSFYRFFPGDYARDTRHLKHGRAWRVCQLHAFAMRKDN